MMNVARRAGTADERCNQLMFYSSCPTDAKPLLVAFALSFCWLYQFYGCCGFHPFALFSVFPRFVFWHEIA